jgi:Ca2+/Na+ antiporter
MTLDVFLGGCIFTMCLGIGLFQLRFWVRTRDRLFLGFALAFFLLAVNRIALTLTTTTDVNEGRLSLYVIRLVAFVIILLSIIDKNRAARRAAAPSG